VNFSPCNEQPYASQWYRGKSTEASARLVPVRAGQTTGQINARLTGGGRISGRILSGISGKPVANVCVELATSAGTPTAISVSGKSGNYRIPHVAAGRWVLASGLCELTSRSSVSRAAATSSSSPRTACSERPPSCRSGSAASPLALPSRRCGSWPASIGGSLISDGEISGAVTVTAGADTTAIDAG
jgi:hypothetical protein